MSVMTRTAGLITAAATALAVTVVAAPPAQATFRGDPGVILFSRSDPILLVDALLTVSPSGGDPVPLAPAANLTAPVWSPDGTRLAGTVHNDGDGTSDLVVEDADGTHRVVLPEAFPFENTFDPDWSPDGTQLVYRESGSDLWVRKADGTDTPRLLVHGIGVGAPAWSPDGQTIAYSYASNIWTVPAAGGTPSQLTSSPALERTAKFVAADWSPDGQHLAVISDRGVLAGGVCDPNTGCADHLWVVGADGTGLTRLHTGPNDGDTAPSWSPDGTRIAVASYFSTGNRIVVVNADDSGFTQLTTTPYIAPVMGDEGYYTPVASDGGPQWQPLPITDASPPTATVTAPAGGATYSAGQVVAAAYTCADDVAVASCVGSVAAGAPVDTASAGSHTFSVVATDTAGKTTTTTASYSVVAGSASAVVSGGSVVTTDPGGVGATPAVPVQTSVTVPAGVSGTLSVTPQALGTDPTGYALFGQQLVIDGPVATAAAPYTVTFTVDASALGGTAPADVQVFRNGVALTGCTSPTAAVPDPCVVSRGFGPDGDAVVTVRTSHFSTWALGRLKYALTGPYAPVDPLPTLNLVKAGSGVPVVLALGGNRGLDVVRSATSAPVRCSVAPVDVLERTVPRSTPTLTYDSRTGRYTYAWLTDRTWLGCRDLVLTFRDGSVLRTRFALY